MRRGSWQKPDCAKLVMSKSIFHDYGLNAGDAEKS
jgi:hypothetical protein